MHRMVDVEDDAGSGRRKTSISVVHGRAARQLIAPVQEKLGVWQAEVVKLEVMAQRMKASGRTDASIAEAARSVLSVVHMQTQLFASSVTAAPPVIQTHSRVTDAIKVLEMLRVRLEKLLADLGEPNREPR
ncbi:MAG TPA: hypothetical protein VFE52_01915 [Devosia sp.]|jgi:hypothetical protein|nr:hypothetical protein [Devosia sp.]